MALKLNGINNCLVRFVSVLFRKTVIGSILENQNNQCLLTLLLKFRSAIKIRLLFPQKSCFIVRDGNLEEWGSNYVENVTHMVARQGSVLIDINTSTRDIECLSSEAQLLSLHFEVHGWREAQPQHSVTDHGHRNRENCFGIANRAAEVDIQAISSIYGSPSSSSLCKTCRDFPHNHNSTPEIMERRTDDEYFRFRFAKAHGGER